MSELPSIAPSLRPCAWCNSTHIADTICTCGEPCAQGWCPMWPGIYAPADRPPVPTFRKAVQ